MKTLKKEESTQKNQENKYIDPFFKKKKKKTKIIFECNCCQDKF